MSSLITACLRKLYNIQLLHEELGYNYNENYWPRCEAPRLIMSCISRGEAEEYTSHYAPVLSGVTVLCIDQEMIYDSIFINSQI